MFTCQESELSKFAVDAGPCVPLEDGGTPLVDPLCQEGGETPALTASLYTALTRQPAEQALELVHRSGAGRLSRCSHAFVEAMADCNIESLRLADEDEARGDMDLPSFVRHQEEVGAAWLRAGQWPKEVVSLRNRLVRLGIARVALDTGQPVFVWHGPSVPQFIVVAGQGPYG